jgi:hypothetical protein
MMGFALLNPSYATDSAQTEKRQLFDRFRAFAQQMKSSSCKPLSFHNLVFTVLTEALWRTGGAQPISRKARPLSKGSNQRAVMEVVFANAHVQNDL